MKVGDVIKSTLIRPYDRATIVKSDIEVKEKNGNKKIIKSKYIAKYDDGSEITFYGFNIGKTIFKVNNINGQLSLFDNERN